MLAMKKYRLTLNRESLLGLSLISPAKTPRPVLPRADGKFDVSVSHALYDQLQTAALPKENLSDTVIRLAKAGYPRPPVA